MKRLDVNDPHVFDTWRYLYNSLSDQEQLEFYDDLEARYPDQKSFTKEFYLEVLKHRVLKNALELEVVEIGGWKGELAALCMEHLPVRLWVNIELCRGAIAKTVPIQEPNVYVVRNYNTFRWWNHGYVGGQVLIASHIIEHLSSVHLIELMAKVFANFEYVLLEAPINDGLNGWKGYEGTHKLEIGWDIVNALMETHGFKCFFIQKDCYFYEKR